MAERADLTWGDLVEVLASAPPGCRPGERASVVGVCDAPEGRTVIIEFGDGSSLDVAADLLRRCEAEPREDG